MSDADPALAEAGLTEAQAAGTACVNCAAEDVALFAAGTRVLRGGNPPVRVLPVKTCTPCAPPEHRLIVIASSNPEDPR